MDLHPRISVCVTRSLPMRILIPSFTPKSFVCISLLATVFVILLSPSLVAQQPPANSIDVQREAMRKLSFLTGHWSGPITVVLGPGEPLHLTQTENVEYKLDGL